MSFGNNTVYGAGTAGMLIAVLPFFILVAGIFSTFLIGVTYFQVYFSVLVSMNATRKKTVISILVNIAAMLLGINAVMALIWKLVPNEISETGLRLMPLFIGIMFLAAALCVLLGSVIVRWGKIGMVIFAFVSVVLGVCIGASFAIADSDIISKIIEKLMGIGGFNFWIVAAAGIAVYLISGAVSLVMTRKMEVRV